MAIESNRLLKNNNNLSEYERERLDNILNVQGQIGNIFDSVQKSAQELAKSILNTRNNVSCNRKRSHNLDQLQNNMNETLSSPSFNCVRRSARLRHEKKKKTNYNEQNDSDDNDDGGSDEDKKAFRKGSLRIKFPWNKTQENKQRDKEYYDALGDSDFICSDDEEVEQYNENYEPRSKKKFIRSNVPTARLAVSQVTSEMLSNITYSSCGKNYSSDGTTCHQCRQKTLDQKSYCRYKKCRGVRGMFCGFCLGKRYGEDVAEVLLNPKWACPPCRGYCNCSICRRKQGRNPTGQLVQVASANGYKSVRHMLSSIEGEDSEKSISSESENDNNESKHDNSEDKQDKVSKSDTDTEQNITESQCNSNIITNELLKTDNDENKTSDRLLEDNDIKNDDDCIN